MGYLLPSNRYIIPATSALYYVAVKQVRKNRGSLLKNFFGSFRDNLGTGILLTCIVPDIRHNHGCGHLGDERRSRERFAGACKHYPVLCCQSAAAAIIDRSAISRTDLSVFRWGWGHFETVHRHIPSFFLADNFITGCNRRVCHPSLVYPLPYLILAGSMCRGVFIFDRARITQIYAQT